MKEHNRAARGVSLARARAEKPRKRVKRRAPRWRIQKILQWPESHARAEQLRNGASDNCICASTKDDGRLVHLDVATTCLEGRLNAPARNT